MFQDLRLKMTLINVAIMLALFFLLISSTYYFAKNDLIQHTGEFSKRIIANIEAGLLTDIPSRFPPPPESSPKKPPLLPHVGPPPGINFFFVKVSPDGVIAFKSTNQPLDDNALKTITAQAFWMPSIQNTLSQQDKTYYYQKSTLHDNSGTIIVFHDLTPAFAMLQLILTAFMAVGVVCAILSFAASFYMANRAMLPIKEAWQQQQDFLSNASHELRTPLTIIQTNLDIIIESQDETVASQMKWLNNIQEESICMKNLVNSLLFLARADSKQQPTNKNRLPFAILLTEAAAPFEAVARQKNLFLKVETTPGIEILGDEAQLKQVIAILLDNASRHTAAGGQITVTLSQKNDKIQLTVADTGEGMETKHLERIFERFYQVDTSRNKGGSGLGLSIAKWIIENHGGSITANSTLGLGTVFTLVLPSGSNV